MSADATATEVRESPRPSPLPPRPYSFPAFEWRTLDNGIRLLVAPVSKLPLVTVAALVDAGAACDPAGREGLAQLTASALTEGTVTSDGAELTDRFERLGTSLESSADWDAAVARMTVVAERLPDALALFAEVLLTPSFPEREVERLKAERLAEILQTRAEPRGLADEMFERFAYAPGARYGAPEGGTTATVTAITRADIETFYRERYRPGAVTLVVVGDVKPDDVVRLAGDAFAGWVEGIVPAILPSDAPALLAPAVHVVAKGDAPQSELRVGHVGIPRSHPDYFPVTIMNAVLGGLFSSRINLNLREAHAYTYGAFSAFDWRRGAGPFVVSTAVKTDVTDAAAREVLHEIDRMRAAEITEAELSLATSYLDGVFPIRFETTASIAAALINLVLFSLPPDYYDTYRANVRAVTSAAVLAAAQRHLDPTRLQIVVVGDPATVREPLEAVGVGPVEVHDPTS